MPFAAQAAAAMESRVKFGFEGVERLSFGAFARHRSTQARPNNTNHPRCSSRRGLLEAWQIVAGNMKLALRIITAPEVELIAEAATAAVGETGTVAAEFDLHIDSLICVSGCLLYTSDAADE